MPKRELSENGSSYFFGRAGRDEPAVLHRRGQGKESCPQPHAMRRGSCADYASPACIRAAENGEKRFVLYSAGAQRRQLSNDLLHIKKLSIGFWRGDFLSGTRTG
ncbi:MAG TPA: hypothetical protein DCY10_05140 [Clostridiales bacterium]|nr:hypothetical protein [Clostridiales bacterium]